MEEEDVPLPPKKPSKKPIKRKDGGKVKKPGNYFNLTF